MKNILREYGVIGALLVIAVGGYFLIGDRPEDILAYSLDAIGNRLTALVADDSSKAEVADAFDRFKARVDSNEVAPEQIETVVASVLNLTVSGASLSTEEAEMVLDLATETMALNLPMPQMPDVANLPTPPLPTTPFPAPEEKPSWFELDETRRADVGTRVSAMIKFADQMPVVAESDAGGRRSKNYYRFDYEDGLHVVIDSLTESLLKLESFSELATELSQETWVRVQQDVEKSQQANFERIKITRQRIGRARAAVSVEVSEGGSLEKHDALLAMERFHRLQELGLVVKMDSSLLQMRLEMTIREAMNHLKTENKEGSGASSSSRVRVRENSN